MVGCLRYKLGKLLMNLHLLITYILSILLFLGTPGPVTVLVVSASIKDGFMAGLKTVAGTNTASLILIGISFIIIKGLFTVSETALNYLTLFGGLYLLYFAITILKDRIDITKAMDANSTKVSPHHFRDGFTIGLSNPKDILFFMAFFPLFLGVYPQINQSMLILTVIWVLMDYAILTTYSFIFSKVSNNQVANGINQLSGGILLLVAVYIVSKTTISLFS